MFRHSVSKYYGCFSTPGILAFIFLLGVGVIFAQPAFPVLTNLSQFNGVVESAQRMVCPLRLEGTVLFADPRQNQIALQDDSGAALLTVPQAGGLKAGDKILLEGSYGIEGPKSSPAVVENDGRHGVSRKPPGSIYLERGKHRLRVGWFNALAGYDLKVYYQGPGIPQQRIPKTALFRAVTGPADGQTNWLNGLDYRAYEGQTPWNLLPDFTLLKPVKTGITADFDIGLLTRSTNAGVEFRGYLDVPKSGSYTFITASDDGSRLFIDEDPLHAKILATNLWPEPRQLAIGQIMPEGNEGCWAKVEGLVTFAEGKPGGAIELEISTLVGRVRTAHMDVYVADGSGISLPVLSQSLVRILGFASTTSTLDGQRNAGRLLVQNFRQITILKLAASSWLDHSVTAISNIPALFPEGAPAGLVRLRGKLRQNAADGQWAVEDEAGRLPVQMAQLPPENLDDEVDMVGQPYRTGTNLALLGGFYRELSEGRNRQNNALPLLTTVEEVKRLSLKEAARKYPVRIRGIVTKQYDLAGMLQDSSGGLYWAAVGVPVPLLPQVGDYWEAEGETYSIFTPGIRVFRARVLNRGRLPEPVHPSWDQLNDGSLDSLYVEIQGVPTGTGTNMVTLLTQGGRLHVLLTPWETESLANHIGALVRLRGCFGASFGSNHEIKFGEIHLYTISITVDEPAPADPFALPAKRVSELRLFNMNAGPLQRVKVAGQIIGRNDGQYYLMDGANGLRFVLQRPLELSPGEQVEVVGFPELSGASPLLREAVVRRISRAALPRAQRLAETNLLEAAYDATRVEIESHLVSLRADETDVFLDLQAGTRTYVARLPGGTNHLPGIPLHSRLAVTGIYARERSAGNDDSFELLLNSPADIQVLERPSWWTPGHAATVAGVLLAALLVTIGWVRSLRGQVERKTSQLRIEIEERKRMEVEAERLHKELLETSREAGMAEVATSVLHNVGNVLNSVNVSASLISDHLKQSKTGSVGRVADLLLEHETDLGQFLASDPKGKQLPSYLSQLAGHLKGEQSSALHELSSLNENIEHIKNIVAMQQNYARVAGVEERVKVAELVEDALRMNGGAMERHHVQIHRKFDPQVPPLTLDKHKVLQILINLLRNAKYACDESGRPDKQITVAIAHQGDRIRITVADNGVGIPAENLSRIFSQGFTTRKTGHGFGLHSGILAARELGGTLTVRSEGAGQGAVFTLELPVKRTKE